MSKFPEHLYGEWHPIKNEKPLDDYAQYSKYRAYWICSDKPHHEWQSRLAHRYGKNGVNGTGCPYCANKILLLGENDLASQYPQLIKEWSSKNSIKPDEVVFGYSKKVTWVCNKAHEWEDTVSNRTLLGRGCPYCNGAKPIVGKNDLATLYPELVKEWSDKNDFKPQDVLIQSNRKPIWVCGKGHEWQTSVAHRTGKKATGCPYCTNQKVAVGFNDLATTHSGSYFLKEWSIKNTLKPKDLSAGSIKKVIWNCELDHEWESSISARIRGYGCPYCTNRIILKGFNDLATTHTDLAKEWSAKNELKSSQVIGAKDEKVWWQCVEGHEWEQSIWGRKIGNGCPRCNNITSTPENEIADFLEQFNFKVKRNDRTVLKGLELDFYIPEKNIAVEFNGLYWHTESRGKGDKYHYNKWLKCKEQGVQLIQIWEDDWNRNPEKIKNIINERVGGSTRIDITIQIKSSTAKEVYEFIEDSNIQINTDSEYVGVYDMEDNKLIVLYAISKEVDAPYGEIQVTPYYGNKIYDYFAETISYIEKTYEPRSIALFSDNSLGDNLIYLKYGFCVDKEIEPEYKYVINKERKNKNYITKTQLAKLNNIERIWDAGKTRWVKDIK